MSVRIHDNLFVGDMADYYVCNGLDIVSCTSPSVPDKGRHLQIDMVDALQPRYFHIEQFIAVRDWINPMHPTLIHCSKGRSRGPSMALYYMAFHNYFGKETHWSRSADGRNCRSPLVKK